MVDNDKALRHNRFVIDPGEASGEYGQQVVAAGFLLVVPFAVPDWLANPRLPAQMISADAFLAGRPAPAPVPSDRLHPVGV
jgi:hypothetical protein